MRSDLFRVTAESEWGPGLDDVLFPLDDVFKTNEVPFSGVRAGSVWEGKEEASWL